VVMAKLVIFGDERTWKRFERCRLVHQLQQNSGKGIRDECSCYIGIQLQTQFWIPSTNPRWFPPLVLHVSFFPESPFQDDLTRDQCAKSSLSSCLHQHPQNFLKSENSLEILTTNDNDNFSTFITNRQDDEDQQRYVFPLRSVSCPTNSSLECKTDLPSSPLLKEKVAQGPLRCPFQR
jgi:hypothetical protein